MVALVVTLPAMVSAFVAKVTTPSWVVVAGVPSRLSVLAPRVYVIVPPVLESVEKDGNPAVDATMTWPLVPPVTSAVTVLPDAVVVSRLPPAMVITPPDGKAEPVSPLSCVSPPTPEASTLIVLAPLVIVTEPPEEVRLAQTGADPPPIRSCPDVPLDEETIPVEFVYITPVGSAAI